MRPTELARVLDLLVPEDSYQSPQVPTLRWTTPCVVTVFGPRVGERATRTEPPYQWLVNHAVSGDVVAFARTATLTPVVDFRPEPVPPFTGRLDPRSADAELARLWPQVTADFFAGRPADSGSARSLLDVYASTVPPRYLPWVRACCADLFDWLDAATR